MKKDIGEKIKYLRRSHNMTLKELSMHVGLSSSHLSQIEHGLNTPSLYSLRKIAQALEAQLSYFLDELPMNQDYIVRNYDYHTVKLGDSPLQYNRLSNDAKGCSLEAMQISILPHSQSYNVSPQRHQGEEFIYILEGLLTVLLEEQEYILNPGDSMHYQATLPHEWLNKTQRLVRLISVNTPRIWTLNDVDYKEE
ncbi:MAG: XRE family transcriptional regulator [Firmicutes bacterium]|nr:XRE family transcriptional regulator [Bacillota bacterium]